MIVDFATFCYSGDIHRLHAPGHLQRQVESNGYPFNRVILIYQNVDADKYRLHNFPFQFSQIETSHSLEIILEQFGIDTRKPQYQSPTDKHHTWMNHVVNHITAIQVSRSDYIVFADLDCWMIKQPDSWVTRGIEAMESDPSIFIVSPNDGEPERKTQVMSQQMFLTRTNDFRNADFNQPGYSGNPRDYPEMPEYHAMLEGRMHYHCIATGKYRYVLPPEYRYWHWNRTTQDGMIETDMSKY